jgi:hypothetical protein
VVDVVVVDVVLVVDVIVVDVLLVVDVVVVDVLLVVDVVVDALLVVDAVDVVELVLLVLVVIVVDAKSESIVILISSVKVLGWHISSARFCFLVQQQIYFSTKIFSFRYMCISFVLLFSFISLLYIYFCSLKVKQTSILILIFPAY